MKNVYVKFGLAKKPDSSQNQLLALRSNGQLSDTSLLDLLKPEAFCFTQSCRGLQLIQPWKIVLRTSPEVFQSDCKKAV